MTDLGANYCPRCGAEVSSAAEIRATDGEPLPPEAIGVFEGRGDAVDAHAEIGQRGVRVFVHRGGDEQ